MTSADKLMWQRWEEVDRLLDALLDQPEERRAEALAQIAETDPALHELVSRLLGRVEEDAARVSGPSDAVLAAAFGDQTAGRDDPDLTPGTEVGKYVIGERRGRGGMATVYEATRSDGVYHQRVALKVMRRGLDTDDLVSRFLHERQILSSFTHPNIARLLDGGSLADGRPFLVMELVDGQPITAFADERKLGLPERLDLFFDVAAAVHAAHRQLVVHRDLKPSNILVDADGHVKLLDFGIAKLLEADPGTTDVGARLLTPEYASPEQIRGDPVTTATDVYQLGLLLRELLTGLPPSSGDTGPGRPPVPPSRSAALEVQNRPDPVARATARRSTPARLARTLGGDLDVIVAKAVRPEPEERYASAEELAADVRRYLRGLPIVAHPESAMYRLRKFAGRRPLVLPAVGVLVLAVAAFVVALALQNARIIRERDAARVASERALATQSFLVDLLRSSDPLTAGTDARSLTVEEALQRGRLRIRDELADQPEVRNALLVAMGMTFSGLGRPSVADTLLAEALEGRTELYGPDDARTLDVISAMAANHERHRNHAAADSFFHLEWRGRLAAGPLPDSTLARIAAKLSTTRRELNDLDSALALAGIGVRALAEAGDTLGPFAGYYETALGSLGPTLRAARQFDSALAIYRQILARQRAEPKPDHYALAVTLNNMGFLLRNMKDLPAAEREYRAAIAELSEVLDPGHPTSQVFANNLAAVLEFMERWSEVDSVLAARLDAATAYWPDGSWRIGMAAMTLGEFRLRQSRPTEAVEPLRRGVESYVTTLGPLHAWTSSGRASLGVALWRAGRRAEALKTLDAAYLGWRALAGGPNPEGQRILADYIKVFRKEISPALANRFEQLLPPPDSAVSSPDPGR